MKQYIKSITYIFGMSFSRKLVLPKLESLSPVINTHIIECVVYSKQRYMTLSHWIGELASWMNRANKLKCSSKLKAKDYVSTLFGQLGNSLLDADYNLDEYKRNNLDKPVDKQYPDFEITDELISELYKRYQLVIKISLPILMSKDIKSVSEWEEILTPIFTQ